MAFYETFTVEQLNRALTFSKWAIGISGLFFAIVGIGNLWISDRIVSLQKKDKIADQAEIKELKAKLSPRQFTPEQRATFIADLKDTPKGIITLVFVSPQTETMAFVEQMRALITDAGFSVAEKAEHPMGYVFEVPPPWLFGLVVRKEQEPAYALSILRAFKHIGIEPGTLNGDGVMEPGGLKIYIGSR